MARPADGHLPALIAPSPLPGAEGRYVVLNAGHSFRYAAPNYLLFPRWGDWAVLRLPAAGAEEEVVQAGFFDEAWR